MSIVRLVAVAALVLPGAAFASNTFDLSSSSCSGSLVSSYTGGLSFACTGDFSLGGGFIESDTFIVLSATGSLNLDGIRLKAHDITVSAGSQLMVEPGASLEIAGSSLSLPSWGNISGGNLRIRVPAISQSVVRPVVNWKSFAISAGATVQFQQPGTIQLGAVPEPGSVALMVAGLMAIGLMARKGSKA